MIDVPKALLSVLADAYVPGLDEPNALIPDEWGFDPVSVRERLVARLGQGADWNDIPVDWDLAEPFKAGILMRWVRR